MPDDGGRVDAAPEPGADDAAWSPLVDVRQRSMVEPLTEKNTALARCVDRVLRDLDDPNGVISAFSNYAS